MSSLASEPIRRRRGRPPKAAAGDTKNALMEAALRLFGRHGYAGTSIRAIAREVGLSESVLYAHFASKRAIFDAVLQRHGPGGAVVVLDGLDPGLADDPPAFIRALVAGTLDAWDTDDARQLISMMGHDGLVHDETLVSAIRQALERLAEQFARWIAAGRVPADVGAPLDLAYTLFSPVGLARLLWLHAGATPQQRREARDRVTRHTELFITAVFRHQQ